MADKISTQATVDGMPTNMPSRKQIVGAVVSIATTAAWGALNTYVFKDTLTPDQTTLITGAISIVAYAAAAYLTPHAPNEGIQYVQTISVPVPPPAPSMAISVPVPGPVGVQPVVLSPVASGGLAPAA